ncbi:MAG TPA: TIGR04283 family arsenosugar biosynthesis glycosyltransferase [Thermoanaerobaculia bacterium]|nr:TIGR04283 family arsenosugar biosynthesis glycosyltransferase [Thermoanaerobaculia bacterium]
MRLSVIIPARDEAETITEAVVSAFEAGAAEVVVADGGSSDATMELARRAGAMAISDPSPRGRRLNLAAAATSGEILLFLHADSRLPEGAADAIAIAIREGACGGGFKIRFREEARRLDLVAAMINLRSALTRAPWGDQAQWIRREIFEQTGGFLETSLMDDYELSLRMKRLGKTVVLRERVVTSGRRFLDRGILVTTATNWWIILRWRLGASADTLTKIYRRGN